MASGDILSTMDVAIAASAIITLTPAAGVGYAITALYSTAAPVHVWGINSGLDTIMGIGNALYSAEFRKLGTNLKILISNSAPFSFKNTDGVDVQYYGYSMVEL